MLTFHFSWSEIKARVWISKETSSSEEIIWLRLWKWRRWCCFANVVYRHWNSCCPYAELSDMVLNVWWTGKVWEANILDISGNIIHFCTILTVVQSISYHYLFRHYLSFLFQMKISDTTFPGQAVPETEWFEFYFKKRTIDKGPS